MADAGRRIRPTEEEEARWGDDPDWIDLAVITDAIDAAEADVKRLKEERAGYYRRLVDKGVPRSAVAHQAGVTDMAVRFVLEPELKKKRSKAEVSE